MLLNLAKKIMGVVLAFKNLQIQSHNQMFNTIKEIKNR